MVTADEVLQIAEEFGFKFSRAEFEREVKRSIDQRFAAGDLRLEPTVAAMKSKPRPPMSSCARGCLSYTVSWHPSELP